jgi:hypothetical protein
MSTFAPKRNKNKIDLEVTASEGTTSGLGLERDGRLVDKAIAR